MPYLPPQQVEETVFPSAYSKDLAMQVRMQAELFRRKFPALQYFVIKTAVTPAVANIAGATGSTIVDSLYGEAVDPASTTWSQPHLSGVKKAADPQLYLDPVPLHIRVQKVNRYSQLQKQGFERTREFKAYIPSVLLDEAGVTCKPGDYFRWDTREYIVLQEAAEGYWKNTNIRTMVVLSCESRVLGS